MRSCFCLQSVALMGIGREDAPSLYSTASRFCSINIGSHMNVALMVSIRSVWCPFVMTVWEDPSSSAVGAQCNDSRAPLGMRRKMVLKNNACLISDQLNQLTVGSLASLSFVAS